MKLHRLHSRKDLSCSSPLEEEEDRTENKTKQNDGEEAV